MRRTQIYLDEDQADRLDNRADQTGSTRSELIRDAVDSYLAQVPSEAERLERFRGALRRTAGSLPDLTSDRVEQMRTGGARKLSELERRGRR